MPITYGVTIPKVRWLNETTWCCDRHLPSAQIPASMTECWYYGCISRRPARPGEEAPETAPAAPVLRPEPEPEPPASPEPEPEPEPVQEPVEDLQTQKERDDWNIIQAALKEYQERGTLTELPDEPEAPADLSRGQAQKDLDRSEDQHLMEVLGPSPAERKRGATQMVRCSVCQAVMWRRPKDAAERKVFWCKEHLNQKVSQP